MFQPETEDMLPRMAPKPSGSTMGANEPLVRPQVPEVSILFGQQTNNMQAQAPIMQQTQQTTSYAAWKKQMLPRVTFPPPVSVGQETTSNHGGTVNNNLIQGGLNGPINSVFPLRSIANPTIPPTSTNGYIVNSAIPSSSTSTTNENPNMFIVSSGMAGTNPTSYRKNTESCGIYQTPTQQQPVYRKSLDMPQVPQAYSCSRDVLTICAGTQTDGLSSSPPLQQGVPSNVATKQDVEDLRQIVQELRHEQHCLIQMMETFIRSQANKTPNTECKDVAIQVNTEIKEGSPITNGHTPLPPVATNRIVQQLKQSPNILQTPKGKPMAQSTTYRPNSPQSNRLQEYQQSAVTPAIATPNTQPVTNYVEWNNNQQLAAILPNPTTDKSLMMNELALKYLPNEKLVELLKELNMNCPTPKPIPDAPAPSTPLRNIDNFERSPSDISNASYKYLKKYRLLPEDNIEDGENQIARDNNTPVMNQQTYSPAVRSPVQQRQNPVYMTPKACSPYQQQVGGNRLPQSPLARNETTPATRNNNMLDLENIKHQPKFL